MIKLKAICITQGNPDVNETRPGVSSYQATIYLTAMKVGDLGKIAAMDRVPKGYQRPPDRTRFVKKGTGLVDYMTKQEGILPTSVLLSAREPEKINFERETDYGWYQTGTLEIPNGLRLQLIDGQHRLSGLREEIAPKKPGFLDYVLPVSILVLPNPYKDILFEEMRQFYIVTARAEGIETDVAYSHLARMYEKFGLTVLSQIEGVLKARKGRAMGVTRLLSNVGIWKDRISLPGIPRPSGYFIPSETMADSIARWIFRETVFEMMDDKDLSSLLGEYWGAIAELYKAAFANPEEYTIQSYMGVHSLHMIFPAVYELARQKGPIDKDRIKDVLQPLCNTVPTDYWSRAKTPLTIFREIRLGEARRVAAAFRSIIEGKAKDFQAALPPR